MQTLSLRAYKQDTEHSADLNNTNVLLVEHHHKQHGIWTKNRILFRFDPQYFQVSLILYARELNVRFLFSPVQLLSVEN